MSIGVIVPEFINSFFAEVIMGIQSVMNPKGYHILISQSNESADIEFANLKAMEEKMVDGIIISVTQDTRATEYFKTLREKNLPIVFFNRIAPEVSAYNVIIDDYKWAFTAVEHLIKEGYKRIAHLAGPENLFLSKERKRGYIDALKKYGYPIEEELIIPAGILMESGITAAYSILEMPNKPDAIFAVNDPAAIGAMKTLQKKGMVIPHDIAFVGFSESQKALIIEPNLTSVEQPTFEMGKVTAELLLEQIKNNSDETRPSKTIILDAKLNIRESSIKK